MRASNVALAWGECELLFAVVLLQSLALFVLFCSLHEHEHIYAILFPHIKRYIGDTCRGGRSTES